MPVDAVAGRCAACRSQPPAFAALHSAGRFDGLLRTTIHRLKYRGQTDLARPLAGLLVDVWAAADQQADVVVPVPQHPRRTRERGWQPTAAVARHFAAQTRLRCAPRALARVRYTTPQVGLSGTERWSNVRHAFAPGPQARLLCGRSVVLVDDVATTGATLRASAAACRAAGASRVTAVVLARELSTRGAPAGR